jgi:hypothetical protein
MKNFFLIISLFVAFNVFAQDNSIKNIRADRKFGIGVQLLGPTILTSLQLDYFITQNLNLEVGVGLFGYYGGAKWYFGSKVKPTYWAPYIGGCYISAADFSAFVSGISPGAYFPLGIQFISKGGFTFATEVAGLFLPNVNSPVWGAIKLGYHF